MKSSRFDFLIVVEFTPEWSFSFWIEAFDRCIAERMA
jgi:hypothetical protein